MIIKILVISVKSRIVEVNRKQQVICIIATGKLKQRVWTKLCWKALKLFWLFGYFDYYTYQRIPEISFPLIVHSVTVPPGLCIDSFLKDFNIMILRVVSSQFRYLRTRDR